MALECLLELPVETRGDFHLVGYLEETLDVFPHFFYFFDKFGVGLMDWFSLQRLQIVITVTVTDDHWSPFATALHLEFSLPDREYLSATHFPELETCE